MRLSGSNTFDGPVSVTAGTLILGNARALGTPTAGRTTAVSSGATLALDSVGIQDPNNWITLSLAGTGDTLVGPISGALVNLGGNNTVPCAITLTAASQIASLTAGNKLTLNGGISGANIRPDGLWRRGYGTRRSSRHHHGNTDQERGGTLTLSSANSYSGMTLINAGAVVLAHALAAQNSTITTLWPAASVQRRLWFHRRRADGKRQHRPDQCRRGGCDAGARK